MTSGILYPHLYPLPSWETVSQFGQSPAQGGRPFSPDQQVPPETGIGAGYKPNISTFVRNRLPLAEEHRRGLDDFRTRGCPAAGMIHAIRPELSQSPVGSEVMGKGDAKNIGSVPLAKLNNPIVVCLNA